MARMAERCLGSAREESAGFLGGLRAILARDEVIDPALAVVANEADLIDGLALGRAGHKCRVDPADFARMSCAASVAQTALRG
jgi:hypothetical protein